jgi:hypothetical protein
MTRLPEALEEKCFLKCFGEGTDMVITIFEINRVQNIIQTLQLVNGRLAEDKIYAQFASVSAGDMNKLMEMYSTMGHCASSTSLFH